MKIIAHRGFWKVRGSAQNSLSSLSNAIDFCAFGSEFDVQVTADGVAVVFHDEKAGRISIENATYAELCESGFTLRNGERIPTLADYLKAWGHSATKLILEIKPASSPERETAWVEKVLEIVAENEVQDNEIEFISFSMHVCKELVRLRPFAKVLYLNGDVAPAEIKSAGLSGMDYSYRTLRKRKHRSWISEAHSLGLTVNVWTVNRKCAMKKMIRAGVDYITTNEPQRLRKLLAKVE